MIHNKNKINEISVVCIFAQTCRLGLGFVRTEQRGPPYAGGDDLNTQLYIYG